MSLSQYYSEFQKKHQIEETSHKRNSERALALAWRSGKTGNILVTPTGVYQTNDLIIDRLNEGFCFDHKKLNQFRLPQIREGIYCKSDLFQFISRQYDGLSDSYEKCKVSNICQISTSIPCYHRTTYMSDQRTNMLKTLDFQEMNNPKGFEKYYQGINTSLTRLAAMACCIFDFTKAYQTLRELDAKSQQQSDFTRPVQILDKIIRASSEDKGDYKKLRTEFENCNLNNNASVTDQDIREMESKGNILNAEIHSLANAKNEKGRLFVYYNAYSLIIQQFKDLSYDEPYFQLIAAFLSKDSESFQNYLMGENRISFYDQFILCLKYLDDIKLRKFFQLTNSLDHLILNGKDGSPIDILRNYLDRTGDIQLVGTIAAHFYILGYKNEKELSQLYDEYRKVLNCYGLYQERVSLEKEVQDAYQAFKINKLERTEKFERHERHEKFEKQQLRTEKQQISSYIDSQQQRSTQPKIQCQCGQQVDGDRCSQCQLILPQCEVCDSAVLKSEGCFSWCLTCKHGGHEAHIIDWFLQYVQCPNKNCLCECNSII